MAPRYEIVGYKSIATLNRVILYDAILKSRIHALFSATLFNTTMTSQVGQFGQEISGNRPRLTQLSKEARIVIYTVRCTS